MKSRRPARRRLKSQRARRSLSHRGTRDSGGDPGPAAASYRERQSRIAMPAGSVASLRTRPILGSSDEPEEGSCLSCCSIALVDADHRRPCRDSTPADRRVTRVCAIPPIRLRSRRSSPSCAPPATTQHGRRLRGLIVILWRAGLRIHEALALAEADLDQRRGAVLVRRGKGGRRREVGMDAWGWTELQPWLETRVALPVGPLFCVLTGPTRGRHWSSAAARASYEIPRSRRVFAGASRRTSSGTPTPSRWRAKACR